LNNELLFLRLLFTTGISLARAKDLLQLISIEELFEAQPNLDLFGFKAGVDLNCPEIIDKAKSVQKRCQDLGISIICPNQNEYPSSLNHLHDPPLVLFAQGVIPDLSQSTAIVGTRRPSINAFNFTQDFAKKLGQNGITVVSGLARGIDTAAHRGCLDAGGETVAVIASGLDCIYPSENCSLAKRITLNGVVISEYAPGVKPLPFHFPIRNRIIAALASSTLVAEAPVKSGALITADLALELGKEVMAFPSAPLAKQSQGSLKLLKEGAHCITEPHEINDIMGWESNANQQPEARPEFSKDEQLILDALDSNDSRASVDVILQKSGLGLGLILGRLSDLEIKKAVIAEPGSIWRLGS
jgi:DNA processing protein